jgi:formylglycine-generating enzyme required for sulfatase activity
MAGQAIFIGYRRDDTADVAGRIYDALEARFGRERVFKDVDNIPVGANFGQYIKSILPRCRVALILMGQHWVDARDGSGKRRLEDPNDWVRIEVETALATPDLQVVPVLVNGAQMPRAEDLPATLHPILHLNAAVIRRDPDFRDDIDRLGTALRASVRTGFLDLGAIGGSRKPPRPTRPRREGSSGKRTSVVAMAAFALLLVGGAAAGWWSWQTYSAQQSNAAAEREFAAASEADTPQALEEFLAAHPNSAHALAARGRIAELRATGVTIGERFVRAGEVFDDCDGADWCPRMVVIPPVDPAAAQVGTERIAVGRYEVTFAEWDACVAGGGCNGYSPIDQLGYRPDQGLGRRGNRPVINVSWNDAQAYVQWLSQRTGQRYRLLTEAEWEHAARAGTTTDFWWGDQDPVCEPRARNGAHWYNCRPDGTLPVGSFQANAFGLYDVHGNVWEWVENAEGSYRVLRGGSWGQSPQGLHSASRTWQSPNYRYLQFGFRVSRLL